VSAGPEYKTLNDALAITQIENSLVCMDCGVVVISKEAHDRLHSLMSSWAWAIAVLKVNHASEEIHDKWNVVPRIDSKLFGNNNENSAKYEGD
jgi:hypothetical protein